MSHEEAMALPLAERPLNYRLSSAIYHAVFEHIGEATLCWEPKPTGVFHSAQASDVAVRLCFKIAEDNEIIKEGLESEVARLRKALEDVEMNCQDAIKLQDQGYAYSISPAKIISLINVVLAPKAGAQ